MKRLLYRFASWLLGKQASAVRGYFTATLRNADGSVAWSRRIALNGTTTAGLNDMLNVYFGGSTPKTTWFIGLIDAVGFSSLNPADTMASHGGWAENTGYSAGTRPSWGPGSASGGSITNGTAVTFAINASVSIKGAFLASDSTKGGTAGLLWSSGVFGSTQVLTSGQTLSITYTAPLTAQ